MDWWEVLWAIGAKIHLSPTLGKSLKDSLEGFPGGSDSKESACRAGDLGSIPKSGGSPGGGQGNPLQYSCLENPMDREARRVMVHRVAKSQTRLKQLSTHKHTMDYYSAI